MSVPESERGEGKFRVIVKAEELARYTIMITANEKIFLPIYQRALTDDIIIQAKNAYLKIRTANNINVKEHPDALEKRQTLQCEAVECCNSLLALIELAHRVFHLKSERVKYWGSMTIDVRNSIRRWSEKDSYRYLNI